jgi:hypothetical protein
MDDMQPCLGSQNDRTDSRFTALLFAALMPSVLLSAAGCGVAWGDTPVETSLARAGAPALTPRVDDASAAGASADDGLFDPITVAPLGTGLVASPPKEWTVFVYGHADHTLSASLVRDLGKMADAAIDSQVNVIMLADFDASRTYEPATETGPHTGFTDGQMYPGGALWLRVAGHGAIPEQLATEPELNLDHPSNGVKTEISGTPIALGEGALLIGSMSAPSGQQYSFATTVRDAYGNTAQRTDSFSLSVPSVASAAP